ENPWVSFLLLSSILIQLFVNACALTDQMSTEGRFLLCFAWAVALVVFVESSLGNGARSGEASQAEGLTR
ncbi:MAG: hypothetical protein AAF733_09815, partial [Verrucomicrobiota bacterium]